jgi:hypothetical protein
VADREEELERMVRKVKEYCEERRLEVNVSKTKVMVVSKDGEKVAKVKYGEEELECVNQYVYLGTVFSSNGKWEAEVERRRQTGRAALCSLKKAGGMEQKCAHTGEEAMAKSKLLYGGDIWWAGKKDIGKLETMQNDFIRWISVFQSKDKVSVSNLRQERHIKSIEDSLCIKRLMWLGRLTRMDGNRLVSRVWEAECHRKRAPERRGQRTQLS